jgi:uncharacterized protein (TIGR03067 family)
MDKITSSDVTASWSPKAKENTEGGIAVIRTCMLVFALLSGLPAARTSEDKALERELEALKGTWIAVNCEVEGGKVIPKEALDNFKWTFKGEGKAVFSVDGTDVDYAYSIDPSKSPKTIDLTIGSEELKGKMQFGIYKLEKGKLTFCLTAPDWKKEDRPKEFAVKDNASILVEMERPAKK